MIQNCCSITLRTHEFSMNTRCRTTSNRSTIWSLERILPSTTLRGAAPHVKAPPQPFENEWIGTDVVCVRPRGKGNITKCTHTAFEGRERPFSPLLLNVVGSFQLYYTTSLTSIESNTYKPPKSVLAVPPYVEVSNPVTSILSAFIWRNKEPFLSTNIVDKN